MDDKEYRLRVAELKVKKADLALRERELAVKERALAVNESREARMTAQKAGGKQQPPAPSDAPYKDAITRYVQSLPIGTKISTKAIRAHLAEQGLHSANHFVIPNTMKALGIPKATGSGWRK